MKFDYWEGKHGMEVRMIPETPKEFAELLRISKNAKAEKPDIVFDFSSDNPRCNIFINKRHESNQIDTLKPTTK